MCEPVTIAAGALAIGGMLLNRSEQQSNMEDMAAAGNKAVADNFARQKPIQDASQKTFADTLGTFGIDQQNAMQKNALDKRVTAATDAAGGAANSYAPAGDAPAVVGKEVGRQVHKAIQGSTANAVRGAAVAAPGDLMFGDQINLGRSAGQLAENSNKARGIASLMDLERRNAVNNANKGTSGIGDLMQLAGAAGGLAGGFGYGPSWGDLFGSAGSGIAAPVDGLASGFKGASQVPIF